MIVYKVVNTINGKVYVGKTLGKTFSLESRMRMKEAQQTRRAREATVCL